MYCIFVKFFGLDHGLNCFWFRSRTLGLEIFRSQPWSWPRKNYRISVSVSVSKFAVSITSLIYTKKNLAIYLTVYSLEKLQKKFLFCLIICHKHRLDVFSKSKLKIKLQNCVIFFPKKHSLKTEHKHGTCIMYSKYNAAYIIVMFFI